MASTLFSSLLLLFAVSFYYFSLSRKTYSQYQAEEDDEQADSLYKKAFISFDLATILYNITLALGLLMIGISLYLLNESHYLLFLLDYLLFMSLLLILPVYKKTLKLLRNYDFPLMALPKDALDLVNSFDEGEKQVSFEENYKIVFRLNQIILPIFYMLAFLVSAATQQFQWLAFLVIVAIHIYINIAQYKATKRYYQ